MNETVLSRFREQIIEAGKQNQTLSIQGGNTKSWYGNPSQASIMSTAPYQGILDYQPEELVITACAGTPIAEIESTLAKNNQILPFEPPHFGDHATFGGVIAAGLAGPARISVGNLRDFVLGTRLMDGRGEDLSFGGKVMKNVAGYDVSRLLPGSLGTLALLLEASVKVLPKPAATASLRCMMSAANALKILNEWAGQPLPLNASAWIGDARGEGELTIRLAGAKAALPHSMTQRLIYFGAIFGSSSFLGLTKCQITMPFGDSPCQPTAQHWSCPRTAHQKSLWNGTDKSAGYKVLLMNRQQRHCKI
ncbi:MAG: hypothetical protein RL727_1346 [Pseudomonadota bacterium]